LRQYGANSAIHYYSLKGDLMSFFSEPIPSGIGDNPILVNAATTNLAPGDYELTATASYNISLDPTAPANSEWVFTCANKSVDNFPITILGGAAITWTLPTGSSSPTSENFVINRGQCVITIRKTTAAENYSVTVSGVTRTQNTSTSVSPLVGVFLHAKPTASKTAAFGWLAVTPGTITNGATLYPAWAAMYPEFVSGANIVFPADVAGMFMRNVGGLAAATGVFQADRTAPNSLQNTGAVIGVGGTQLPNGGLSTPDNYGLARTSAVGANTTAAATDTGGSGTELNIVAGTANHYHVLVGDPETAPDNRAYQLYTLVDTFARSFSAINPVNLVQTLSNSTTEVPSNATVNTRFQRAIWCRNNLGNSTIAAVGYTDLSATSGVTRSPIALNVLGTPIVSSAVDISVAEAANGRIIINTPGVYDISFRAGFRGATVNANYVIEIVRFNAINTILEIIGYSDLQAVAGGSLNVESTCFAIGSFAANEKIGFLFSSAGNGSLWSPTFTIKAISF
jgi:hypothetical protein